MRTIQHCLLALALVGTPALASEAPLLLSLHGSNTLGQRLVPALARSWAAAEGWQETSVAVADDENAIGFVGMGGVGKARALALAYPGMAPMAVDAQSVATEGYPLARCLLLYSAATSRPEARAFVEFVQSDAGQNIVAATGFVAQTIRLGSTPPRADWPAQYRELVAGAI